MYIYTICLCVLLTFLRQNYLVSTESVVADISESNSGLTWKTAESDYEVLFCTLQEVLTTFSAVTIVLCDSFSMALTNSRILHSPPIPLMYASRKNCWHKAELGPRSVEAMRRNVKRYIASILLLELITSSLHLINFKPTINVLP
jgi:hypothetical protein